MTTIRGIPPRTMSAVSRELARADPLRRGEVRRAAPPGDKFSVTPANKPREWRYQTRPSFKRVRGPLVDVFNEAQEVLIVIDLGGFTRGEISLTRTPHHYVLCAARGQQRFEEVIDLPPNVDVVGAREHLVNGVLEIVLPRQKSAPSATPELEKPRGRKVTRRACTQRG